MPMLSRSLVAFGLATCLGSLGALAQTDFAKYIAGLPWKTDAVVVNYAQQSDAKIVVVAHFVNPNVVADSDTGYISFHPSKMTLDKNGLMVGGTGEESSGHGSCRDGQDRWCDGAGNFENLSKEGFDYRLNLSWKIDGQNQKNFNENFRCLWVKKQTFKKNGFTITVTTKML